jgi:hypothetical protein
LQEQVMKKVLIGIVALSGALGSSTAFAGSNDDISAHLDAIERENAAIRRENKALLENKKLHDQNAKLMSAAREPQPITPAATPAEVAAAPATRQAASAPASNEETGTLASVRKGFTSLFSSDDKASRKDPFDAYAADMPVAYKAPPPATPGQLRFWGEGGAIWTGGDPVSQDANLADFSTLAGLLGGGGGVPRHFDLTPKVGWEAATGFDYRFPNSAWHVSGQFRYGEGGRTSESATTAGTSTLAALLPGIPLGPQLGGTTISGSNSVAVDYRETHWLADIAAGYEIAGGGPATAYSSAPASLQIKGGIRAAETVGTLNNNTNLNIAVSVPPPPIPVIGNQFSFATSTAVNTRNSFLGAGPLIGLEGTVPFFGNWTFDYTGDLAVLFGTQHSVATTTSTLAVSPPLLALLVGGGGGNTVATTTAERFGTVLSGDIQAGFGYWITPNIKLGASYRLDTMINVQNTRGATVANLTPDRYTHGPRVTLTGRF